MDQSFEDEKKARKDLFYKQQQQRLQSISIKKDLSADDLIRNILQKVDCDAKISKLTSPTNLNTQAACQNGQVIDNSSVTKMADGSVAIQLPIPSCFLSQTHLPVIYQQVWHSVKQTNGSEFCDRDRLYQLLLRSKLQSTVLANLWTFVNRTIPGQLTQRELFVMLALIGLIQRNSADPVNELYKQSTIPLPMFDEPGLDHLSQHYDGTTTFDSSVSVEQPSFVQLATNQPISVDSFTSPDDDFTDFKSADCLQMSDTNGQQCLIDHEPSHDLLNSFENDTTEKTAAAALLACSFPEDFSVDNQKLEDSKSKIILDVHSSAPEKEEAVVDVGMNNHDRYSFLRQLDNKSNDLDEFGDFHSHSTIPDQCDIPDVTALSFTNSNHTRSSNEQIISNKRRLLNACKQVMQKTFNVIIVNHGEESVLEAFNSKEGANFANDLSEVFAISERIKTNLNILNNAVEIDLCVCLFNEIHNKWNSIFHIIQKSSINLDTTTTVVDNSTNSSLGQCSICSTMCYELNGLTFAGFHYHISCANFWLNYVNSSLPNRQYED